MAFHTYLTTLDGTPMSELAGALERTVAVPLSSVGTASVTVRLDHDDADELLNLDRLLKVVEEVDAGPFAGTRILHFHGRQVAASEEVGANGGTVQATFADPFWTLTRRLLGRSATGYARGDVLNLVDPATIIGELLAALNLESSTGARIGATSPSTPTYLASVYFKPMAELVTELGATLFGPDWRVRPIDYSGGYIGELDVQRVIGQQRDDAVLELGAGLLNVARYTRAVTLEQAANSAYHLPSGFPDTPTQAPLEEHDDASKARYGLLETVVAADLTPDELRRALLRQHIAVRANPRQTFALELVRDLGNRVPRFGIDYGVGDLLPFRAWVTRRNQTGAPVNVQRVNALFRVYQYAASIDSSGVATPTITVSPS